MLIECPECKKQMSDKAKQCVSCGYPLNEIAQLQDVRCTNTTSDVRILNVAGFACVLLAGIIPVWDYPILGGEIALSFASEPLQVIGTFVVVSLVLGLASTIFTKLVIASSVIVVNVLGFATGLALYANEYIATLGAGLFMFLLSSSFYIVSVFKSVKSS